MIEKRLFVDQILIPTNNFIHVRQAMQLVEDGVVLSETYHRWVLSPGDDISGQDPRVQSICRALWSSQGE